MLLASIIAVTIIAFYVALIVGLHRPEPKGRIQALNYPTTFVHSAGESWAIREENEER